MNARDIAAVVLARVIEDSGYSQRVLNAELERSELETRDRGFCTLLVYGTLTWLRPIDRVLDSRLRHGLISLPAPVRAALRVAVFQLGWMRGSIPPFAAIDEAVSSTRRLGGNRFVSIVNGVLRNIDRDGETVIRGLDEPDADRRVALELGLGDSLAQLLFARLGVERTRAVMDAYNAPTPAHARVRRGEADAAIAALATDGIEAVPHPTVASALVCSGGNVALSAAARDGLVTVQDAGSQLPALTAKSVLGQRDGVRILDVCAGVGVKSLQLADVFGPAVLVCTDRDARKLVALRTALLGVDGLVTEAWDAANREPSPVVSEHAPYDVVLIDAPCTALGTMGRHPEVRLRFRPAAIGELASVQRRIVERASKLVREGGLLVYVVCTFTDEETTAQVAPLVESGDFEPVAVADVDVDAFGGRWLWPDRSATDGFYIACLRRRAQPSEEK